MSALIIGKPTCVAPVGAILGEGPVFDPRDGLVRWVDIKGEKIFTLYPDTGETFSSHVPGMVSALGLAADGGYICALKAGFGRLEIVTSDTVNITLIASPENDNPGNRFNDGKVDPLGGFWAGTMDNAEVETSGAWWRLANGELIKLADKFKVTNGPAFDPKRGLVYLTDSAARLIFRAQSDGASLQNLSPFLEFNLQAGYPDGMEVDAEGCLWVAFWDGSAIRRFSPDGALIGEIALPVRRPTSLAFAHDHLFVTSASIGLPADGRSRQPYSGGLFSIRLRKDLAPLSRYFTRI